MTVITAALPLSGLIGHYGYLAVAGLVFVEGFGIPAPGEPAIIAGAVYAGGGHLSIALVAAVAFTAAVVGDSIGYLIGRSLGRARVLRVGRLLLLTPARLARLERFMTRHGGAVIAGARFVEGFRQLNGIVAGITGVPWRRFATFNAVGAACWVGVWTTAGFLAGNHVSAILTAATRYQAYALAAAAVGLAGYALIHLTLHRRRRSPAGPPDTAEPALVGTSPDRDPDRRAEGAVMTASAPTSDRGNGTWTSRPPLSRAAIARLVQLAGAFNVLSAVVPARHGRMAALLEFVPAAGILSARAATAAVGVLLIYLGAGLRRGKHRAWQLAAALAGAGVVLHILKGLDFDAAAASGALLAMLIVVRGRFHAIADPRSRWRALTALTGFAATGFTLGLIEIAIRADRLVGAPGVTLWVQQSALGLLGITGPLHFAHPLAAETVSITTGTFGLLAVVAAAVLLLQTGGRRALRTDADDQRLRGLLDQYGGNDSLGYFALRADKALIWAPSGKAVVAYRVVHGVSLAAGDPIGVEAAWPDAIAAWLVDCEMHGWTPAVLGCGRTGGTAYRRSGLDVIELGDEAVVDTATFTLQGRLMRGVRQAVNRVQRAGYTCTVIRQRDVAADDLAAVLHAADAFRNSSVERGFSMALSRLGDPRDGDCLLVLARDAQGQLRGMLQFVPWGADGFSLDLMRGDRTADNGLTELMVVTAIEAARALGIRRLSLNFAVLRSVFARAEELGAGPVLRLWHRLLQIVSKLWQIESLYRANAKYRPTWQPRYLCFPTARDLPRIAFAALTAEAFLPAGRAPATKARTVAVTRPGQSDAITSAAHADVGL